MSESVLRPVPAGSAGMDADQLLAMLHALRSQERDADFWNQLALCLATLCRARSVVIAQRDPEAEAEEQWVLLAGQAPPEGILANRWQSILQELSQRADSRGFGVSPQSGAALVAVRVGGTELPSMALLEIPERERAQLNELILRARLAADLPPEGAVAAATQGGSNDLLSLLDLMVQVMRESRFGPAALALVNGLSAQLGSTQVALGWSEAGYVRTQAISHLDRFERKTENVQLLEAVFEEALDQEIDIDYPDDTSSGAVLVAHSRFCRVLGYPRAMTLCLRREEREPEAAVLLAGDADQFDPRAISQAGFVLQLLLPWLADLRKRDRWFGVRWWHDTRDQLGKLVGFDHVGKKLVAIVLGAVLLYGLFGSWPHRISADAELMTDSTRLISAPFDGFFDDVLASAGDEVQAGAVLGTLDVQDLYLQESEIRADMRRYEAEADRARAAGQMADVEIARARRAQAEARLDRVLHQLSQARLEAPFNGIVVEGERRDLLGMPLRQGDSLFRLARIEGLYAMVHVSERDIRYIEPNATGELRLLSRPDLKIPFTLETLVPVAQVRGQDGNHFMLKVRLEQEPADWWRPGMNGTARVDAGRQNILWLMTHRLMDTLRMWLWW